MSVTVTSNPGNGCCGCGGVDCAECEAAPTTYEVTLAGITDAACPDCETWNRTYTMTYVGSCTWVENVDVGCSVAKAVIQLSTPGASLVMEFMLQDAGSATIVEWRLIGATCMGPNVLSLLLDLSGCATLPATVTVT